MIAMGAGTNHWFHSDQIYRTFLALVMLCGCEGVNGGGWAHYVGQEKVRPLAGWQTVAFALDWVRPPRHQSGTPFFYLATDQWRYERIQPWDLASPLGRGLLEGRHIADVNALGARLGWLPSYPSFDRSRWTWSTRPSARASIRPSTSCRSCAPGRLRLRLRGSRRARQSPEGDDGVAGEPAGLLGQGARVLPQAPARHHRERACAPRSPRPSCAPARWSGASRRRRASSTC